MPEPAPSSHDRVQARRPKFSTRAAWVERLRRDSVRDSGPATGWRGRYPRAFFLAIEAVCALFGFPGMGWIMSGQALVGVAAIVVSPILGWVVIPSVFPPSEARQAPLIAPVPVLAYLGISTLLSLTFLWLSLAQEGRTESQV
jgi:hypothetical protein